MFEINKFEVKKSEDIDKALDQQQVFMKLGSWIENTYSYRKITVGDGKA